MHVKQVYIRNFRNYEEQKIELSTGINLFYGNNAQGKTNIVESIFLCALGKSFRAKKEKEIIKFDEKEANIKIDYEKKDRSGNIKYIIDTNKKNVLINEIPIKKMSEILGNINIVLFSPEDINIIKDGPGNRRKFLNMLISQLRPNYTYSFNLYLKTLEQKNIYLKSIDVNNFNSSLLDIYDEKIAEYGAIVNKYRNEFIEKLKEKIKIIHPKVTQEKEEMKIKYISDCFEKEKFLELLKEKRLSDIEKGYTSVGIQRDDIYIFINGKRVDTYGSQGQQRTAILSLKLSELEVVKDEIDEYPIFLLDDFMSELDNTRKINFLKNVKNTQIIITCTDNIEIENIEIKRFFVENGKVKEK